jgi:hypothetical protein
MAGVDPEVPALPRRGARDDGDVAMGTPCTGVSCAGAARGVRKPRNAATGQAGCAGAPACSWAQQEVGSAAQMPARPPSTTGRARSPRLPRPRRRPLHTCPHAAACHSRARGPPWGGGLHNLQQVARHRWPHPGDWAAPGSTAPSHPACPPARPPQPTGAAAARAPRARADASARAPLSFSASPGAFARPDGPWSVECVPTCASGAGAAAAGPHAPAVFQGGTHLHGQDKGEREPLTTNANKQLWEGTERSRLAEASAGDRAQGWPHHRAKQGRRAGAPALLPPDPAQSPPPTPLLQSAVPDYG